MFFENVCLLQNICCYPEIFKDIKPHFNQMSTPHWIVLIVTNVFSKRLSVIAVFKSGYILFADSMGVFSPSILGAWKEDPFALFAVARN